MLPEWSEAAQRALGDASVLVVGAGALGSPVATYLAGAGVGRLGIVDDGDVELSNLHRQHLHFTPDLGVAKAHSAAAKLGFLNPEIVVEPYQAAFNAAMVEGQDLVVDCTDSFEARYAVNAACCAAGVPLVEGGVVGLSGLVMAIRPGETACYRCAFPHAPEGAASCAEAGVLGPAAGVIGSLQALEALKLLAGLPALTDAFLQVDLLALDFLRVAVRRRAGLPRLRGRVGCEDMLGIGTLRRVAGEVRRDVRAAYERDPAAKGVSAGEVLAAWPGVHALLSHRIAHALHDYGVPLAPRALAYVSRSLTGIEIHPAARIGEALFIDHGMGVVIGETAEVGECVTMYQGVTLGGTGFATGKRHPTVQDNVTIGSGAKLLGPITIGHGSKIGANAVVIHDVPPNSTVVGNPGHPVRVEGRKPEGPDADWVHLPDPIADALKQLSRRIAELERELADVEGRRARGRGRGRPAPARPRTQSRRWLASPTASRSRSRPRRSSRGCWRRTRCRSGPAT